MDWTGIFILACGLGCALNAGIWAETGSGVALGLAVCQGLLVYLLNSQDLGE